MKTPRLRKPSPALVIACMALVMSMAGTGYAATKISGSQIKNKSVSGAKLKNNTLSSKQIKESKLGKVPAAANADNAAALEGTPAAGFARTANFVRVLTSLNVGDPDVTLVTNGDIAVKARCYNSGGSDRLSIYATTQNNGAILNSEEDDLDGTGPSPEYLNTDTAFDLAELVNDSVTAGNPGAEDGYDDTGFVMNAATNKTIDLLEGSKNVVFNRGGKNCTLGAVFIVS